MKCNRCGKEGVHVCISAGFSALALADQLGESAMLPYATSELRRLHTENEAKDALLRQALEALEYCRSGEDCHPTLTSEAIDALKERLK